MLYVFSLVHYTKLDTYTRRVHVGCAVCVQFSTLHYTRHMHTQGPSGMYYMCCRVYVECAGRVSTHLPQP